MARHEGIEPMEATDTREIYTLSQAFPHKPHRGLIRKIRVRVGKQRKPPMVVQVHEREIKPL